MKRLFFLLVAIFLITSCHNESREITAVKNELKKEGANDQMLKLLEYSQAKERKSVALEKIIAGYNKLIEENSATDFVNNTSGFLNQKINTAKAVFDTIKFDSIDKVKVVKQLDNQYIHKNYYLVNGIIVGQSDGYGR